MGKKATSKQSAEAEGDGKYNRKYGAMLTALE